MSSRSMPRAKAAATKSRNSLSAAISAPPQQYGHHSHLRALGQGSAPAAMRLQKCYSPTRSLRHNSIVTKKIGTSGVRRGAAEPEGADRGELLEAAVLAPLQAGYDDLTKAERKLASYVLARP